MSSTRKNDFFRSGEELLQSGQYSLAIEAFETSLEEKEDDQAKCRKYLGECYRLRGGKGDYTKAREQYRLALKCLSHWDDVFSFDCYAGLAAVYEQLQDMPSAKAAYRSAREVVDKYYLGYENRPIYIRSLMCLNRLGIILMKERKFTEAEEVFNEVAGLLKDKPYHYCRIAGMVCYFYLACLKLSASESARHELREAEDYMRHAYPESHIIPLHFEMANYYEKDEYTDDEIRLYKIAVQINTDNQDLLAKCHYHLGKNALNQRDYRRATESALQARKLFLATQDKVNACELYADSLRNREDAIQHYNNAIQHSENNSQKAKCHYEIAYIHHENKRYLQAIVYYKKAAELYETKINQARCQQKIGQIHFIQGEYFLAIEVYKQAIENYNNEPNRIHDIAFCYDQLAQAYQRVGNYQAAKTTFETLLELTGKHAEINKSEYYFNLGLVVENLRQIQLAEKEEKHNVSEVFYFKRAILLDKNLVNRFDEKHCQCYRDNHKEFFDFLVSVDPRVNKKAEAADISLAQAQKEKCAEPMLGTTVKASHSLTNFFKHFQRKTQEHPTVPIERRSIFRLFSHEPSIPNANCLSTAARRRTLTKSGVD